MNWFTKLFASEKPEKESASTLINEEAVANVNDLFSKSDKIQQYNPSELISLKGFAVIDKMRRDDQIKAALTFKKNGVVATGWTIESPEGYGDEWEIKVFVEDCLAKISGTIDRKIIGILSALDYGFSVTEKVYKEIDDKIRLVDLRTIKPHDIYFYTDKFGTLIKIEQQNKELTPSKFIVYSYDLEFSNHYGTSDLQSAYRAWWAKDNSYKWLSMLLEKMGIPPIFALFDSNTYKGQELTALRKVLKNMQAATTATIPTSIVGSSSSGGTKSIEFWAPELGSNVQQMFIPAMDMFNRDIARSILMPGLLGLSPDQGSGSLARSRTNFDVFMLVIERIRKDIAEFVINEQIIKQLVDLNFVTNDYPVFKFLESKEDDREALLKLWSELTGKNIVHNSEKDEKYIREMLKFPEMDESQIEESSEPVGNESAGNENANDKEIKSGTPSVDNAKGKANREFALRLSREKNQYEKKVDFAKIDKDLRVREAELIVDLREILKEEQDYILKKVASDNVDYADIEIRANMKNKIFASMKTSLLALSEDGYDSISSTIKTSFASSSKKPKPGYVAKQADKWLTTRAKHVSGVLSDKLQNDVIIILSNGIKNGTLASEIGAQIQDVFLPYIGNDNIIEDDEVIEPYRVETIVRTNTTQAFNQGRLVAMRDPDIQLFMAGVEYSAIMDDRTTEICSHLDGSVFRLDDTDLDRLTPPNHFNSVPAETLIKTISGNKPISEIKANDLVYTHKGRYKKVYSVMAKRSDHPVVKELHLSTGAKLRITDEHPILATSGWLIAADVKVGDVLFQNGEQVPGFIDLGIFSPDNYPSIVNEIAVPYLTHTFSVDPSLISVNLKTDFERRPCEIDNVIIDRELENHSRLIARNHINKSGFGFRWSFPPCIRPRNSGHIRGVANKVGIVYRHSIGMLFKDPGRFFSEAKSPMIGTPSLKTSGGVSDLDLINPISNSNSVFFAPIRNNRFSNTKLALDRTNGFIFNKMFGIYKFLKNIFVSKVNHISSAKWSGAAIISIVDVDNNSDLYNLAVEDDETYLANDIIVHNCRSLLVPIMIDEKINKEDFISPSEKGKAVELAGKGFV